MKATCTLVTVGHSEMTETEKFTYWVVKCKTDGCETVILLCPIGPAMQYRHPIITYCRDFEEECPECHTNYTYSILDVDTRDQPAPPKTYAPSPAFLKATKRKPEHQEKPIASNMP